jgi:S-adenosyl-L-methionine hydrolase (adenosine-forming)
LTERRFWLPRISNVFHGRDIFAPVAAYLSAGVPLQQLGERISDPVLLDLPVATTQPDGSVSGEITEIDYFGNLLTNIEADLIAPLGAQLGVTVGATEVAGLYATFGDRAPGELVALIDSSDNLAVAVVNGSAAKRLDASIGQPVVVRKKE